MTSEAFPQHQILDATAQVKLTANLFPFTSVQRTAMLDGCSLVWRWRTMCLNVGAALDFVEDGDSEEWHIDSVVK